MHRFFLPPELTKGNQLILSGGEAHHAARVLRLAPGDAVAVLNGAGEVISCQIGESDRHGVKLRVVNRLTAPQPVWQLTLLQAVPKGKAMDVIIQKATELGAHRIVPLLSERTVVHLDQGNSSAKVDKWRATAIESIKQCGSAWLPQIDSPVSTEVFLGRGESFDLRFVASLQEGAQLPREYFIDYHSLHKRMPQSVAVWIGPEGDFTPAELSLIQSAGARPITLGQSVLRAETAAIYCLSVLGYELQCAQHYALRTR